MKVNSIRSRLTFWILSGLALLLLAAGTGVYFSVRQSLLKSMDAELAVDARIVRFAARGDEEESGTRKTGARRLQERMPSYDDEEGDAFYEIWEGEGKLTERSVSLGDLSMGFPGASSNGEPFFQNSELEDGRTVRMMVVRNNWGGKGKGKGKGGSRNPGGVTTVLAKDLSPIEATLSSLLGGIFLIGVVAAIGAVGVVRFALKLGLKPLVQLGRETSQMDAESLDSRFDGSSAPIELQPVYEQLNELIERLEKSFDRERQFSSDLAHEMRTPVAELKMLNEVALKWEDQSGERTHQESLEIANQLEGVIQALLTLARLDSGAVSVEAEPVNVAALVATCWKPHSKKADERGMNAEFVFKEDDLEIETDPKLLRQILDNLFSNAVEYSPAGQRIHCRVDSKGLEISNAAPHLNAQDAEKIFDRHWRADESRTDSSHVGLGLSLARACAAACGFRLSAQVSSGEITMSLRLNGAEDDA